MQRKTREEAADTYLNNAIYMCDELIEVSQNIDKSRYLDFLILAYGFYYAEFQKISSGYRVKLDKELLWMCFSHCVISTVDNTYIDKNLFYIAIRDFNRLYRYAKTNNFDKNSQSIFLLGTEFYGSASVGHKVANILKSPKL